MLPKLDKTKKKLPGEQLSLVSPSDDFRKSKNKKTALALSLFFCVGLSMIFSIYKSIARLINEKSYPKININFKLPSFKITHSNDIDLNSEIAPILSNDSSLWSFYVEVLPKTNQSFSWTKNRDQLFLDKSPPEVISELLSKDDISNSLIKTNLPEGAVVKENQITKDGYFEYQSIITVPGKQFFLVLKISGNNNLEKSKLLIPLLVERIYWAVIKL